MKFLDTQIVSLAIKGKLEHSIKGELINSTVANEFLKTYSDKNHRANYYIPIYSKRHPLHLLKEVMDKLPRGKGFPELVTDAILIQFSNKFQPLVDFNNYSITKVINDKNRPLISQITNSLEKNERKVILQRFDFLIDNEITCQCVSKTDIDTALMLLSLFIEKYSLKSNFRNCWNDLLILATAANATNELITKDSLLNKFGSSVFQAPYYIEHNQAHIKFSKIEKTTRKNNSESKGYINKGWNYKIIKGGNNFK